MTELQARMVRRWREVEDMSWRGIAERWAEQFGEEELDDMFFRGWSGNQLAGMELCERARELVGGEWE